MMKQWKEKKFGFSAIVITFFFLMIVVIQTVAADNNSTSGPAKGYPDIITIDTIENHITGDSFTIQGKTAQPVGQTLFISVWPNSFRHPTMADAYRRPVYEGSTSVVRGSDEVSFRSWSYTINTTDYYPDEYIVQVSSHNFLDPHDESEIAYQWFLLNSPGMINKETKSVTDANVSYSPISSVTQPAPLPALFTIIAIGCIIMIAAKKRMRKNE
ncbi:MAG: hypothetical protein CVV30_04920 [Methanomicrobiales archaeon HGW-Methanomicrobiales-1]|jgi:hypothetical protein|nr:MAG: hypothetical protein CVV30_04920 [Methanomicrobiales archaeon HGW-Methanomicrobiales-1]